MPTNHRLAEHVEESAEQSRTSCPPPSTTAGESLDVVQTNAQTTALGQESHPKSSPIDVEIPSRDTPTPVSSVDDNSHVDSEHRALSQSVTSLDVAIRAQSPKLQNSIDFGNPFPFDRFRPNTCSSLLKPGAKFTGIQSSEKAEFKVEVDIQHVDMANSFMCGYLNIRGLSHQHPSLTTYFEGEMIGTKYSFVTEHPNWGASEKIDWQHWSRFSAWRPLQKDAKRANFIMKNWQQKENIWMRWKEIFIVPDHTVTDLTGASFDGFYYICFNQISGSIEGAYYHAKSDQYQKIELKPESSNHGFDYGFEFR